MMSLLAVALTFGKRVAAAIPWQVWAILLAIGAAWLWGNHRYHEGEKAVMARWAATVAAAQKKASEADTASHQTVTNHNADVKAGNDAAKKAAQGSKDPLRDGLNALGGGK